MQTIVEQWYQGSLQALLARQQTLPHAILLSGPVGIGKSQFATVLATALLCSQSSVEQPYCGQCQSCKLLQAGTHPDYYRLELEGRGTDKQAKEIKIDQVRKLCHSLVQTSQLSGRKLAVIEPADCMNRNAANSLLKTLEEPSPNTLLLLLTASPSALLPTIRSRCQQIQLRPPNRDQVLTWLQTEFGIAQAGPSLLSAAEGAPFTAAALLQSGILERRQAVFRVFRDIAVKRQDPVQDAAKLVKDLGREVFSWLLTWVQDMIFLASTDQNSELMNVDLEKDLQALSRRIDLQDLYAFYDKVQQALSLLKSSANVQLLFESLMLDWAAKAADRN